MIHKLERRQIVNASLNECWAFFSNPSNLARITPASLDFRIVSDLPEEIYAGLTIEYRVRPLLGLSMTWLTEITHVVRPLYFVDEQRVGPYAIWHHEHHFRGLNDGRVEMHDRVTYRLPFSPLSEVMHPLLVQPQLAKIFDFRVEAVERIFDGRTAHPAGGAAAVVA